MRWLAVFLVVACSGPKSPIPPTKGPLACISKRESGVVECEGIRWDVMVPSACATKPCGIVLDIHGLSMSARMEDANTNMRALGETHGYVVVQPSANPAPPDRSFSLPDSKMPIWLPEDDARLFAFLEHAIDKLAIDRDRVHMTGFSLGAMLTLKIFCAHAEVFASIAPAAGAQGCFAGKNLPAHEASILYLHGVHDRLVPFYSAITLRDSIVKTWAMHVGAGGYVNDRGTVFEFVEHAQSSKLTVDLGGHCIPGSHDRGDAPGQKFSFACEGPSDFTWGERVMAFFRAHPRRP